MKAHVVNEVPIQRTPRVMQVESLFDVPPGKKSSREWHVDLPLDEKPWNVGLIVGASGSGKSSVARALWGKRVIIGHKWPADAAIVDAFPAESSIKDVTSILTSVGFGSPPSWLRPYRCLSTGEQFRATLARAMAETEDVVVMDEFTSTVDRQVAKVASHTVQKAVRRANRQLVAVTCHFDVVDWLQPDWVYQPAESRFTWRSLQRRPELELRVHPVDRSVWSLFRHHHYLSATFHNSARCIGGFIGDECVAFASWMYYPHPRTRNLYMGHRFVVLPDYQGLGIGIRMAEWVGQTLYDQRRRFRFTTAHPGLIQSMARSPRWRLKRRAGGHLAAKSTEPSLKNRHTKARTLQTYSFEYAPPRDGKG